MTYPTRPLQTLLSAMLLCAVVAGITAPAQAQNLDVSKPEALLAEGDFTGAISQARELLGSALSDDERATVQRALAEALVETGKVAEAIALHDDVANSSVGENIVNVTARAKLTLVFADPREARAQLKAAIARFNEGDPQAASVPELMAASDALVELAREDADLNNQALELLERAATKAPDDPAPLVAIGDLLLSRYNNTEALDAYRDALKIDELYAPALHGLAQSQYFDRSSAAREAVERALEVRPSDTDARLLLARIQLDNEDYDQAAATLKEVLDRNPDSPGALTLVAAIQFLQGDVEQTRVTRQYIRKIAPGYVDMYVILSEIVGQNRHYREAARLALMGANMDSKSWRSHALLGINRLRLGDDRSARSALELSFRGDPYDVRTKNTLDLMDKLDEFFRIGSSRFELIAEPDEARLLAPRLFPLMAQAWDQFVDRYGVNPRLPIRIEMYPRHEDFSVRTVGLVGVDIVGVAFGSVLAMDSPSSRHFGDFNWGSVLWHELAHTFHLALSKRRVPRWFTEGLAVYEEVRGGPGWGDDVTPSFLEAVRKDRLNPPSRLNESFLRPSYPEQVVHAYYQGYLLMEMIARDHGDEIFREMLMAFGRGEQTNEVLESVLGVKPDELDSQFAVFVEERFGSAITALDEESGGTFLPLMRQAREAIATEQDDLAVRLLTEAQALYPFDGGAGSTYQLLSALYLKRGERAAGIEQLEKSLAIDADDIEGYKSLAALYAEDGRIEDAIKTYEASLFVDPFTVDVYEALAELHTRKSSWHQVADMRSAIVNLKSSDPIKARYQLADALTRSGKTKEAKQQILTTLEQAPMYDDALELLLRLRETLPPPGAEENTQ